jgi:small subunit ribosomal protein S4e
VFVGAVYKGLAGCGWIFDARLPVLQYKLCRVKKASVGPKGVPYLLTHDGRTIRYPSPDVNANDTVKVDIESGKVTDHLKFECGQLVTITGGHNIGRVGVLMVREKHLGGHEIAHIKDAASKTFSTRTENVFIIGEGNRSYISLPKGKGIKLSIMEEAALASKGEK